jgi:hypothetical protein
MPTPPDLMRTPPAGVPLPPVYADAPAEGLEELIAAECRRQKAIIDSLGVGDAIKYAGEMAGYMLGEAWYSAGTGRNAT